jgi:hypothetical protein
LEETTVSTANVENYSNGVIFVAAAYNHYDGNLIVDGWWQISPNNSQTITAPDDQDLYLRVQGANGGEITFNNFDSFLFWPTNSARFTVSKEPDDVNVRVFQWGSNLENTQNALATDPPPAGWTTQRFFRVGPVNENFQVQP